MEPDNESGESLVGTVLEGAYRIERLIAKHETGAVYEAFHLRLDKPVAVKVMAPELAGSPEALERFRREALATSGLGHPHIVQVFDHSITPTGEPFLAMELLDGEGLDRRLERVGRLSPAATVHIVKQVASALAAAHAQGIVHRNLKPANLCLLELAGERDFVKVLDFGVSKVRSAQMKLTKASMLIGTPDYMCPEQALGEVDEIDHRADQWALACITWECLAGERPFQADDVVRLLERIVSETPAALAPKVPDLPPEMEGVLRRALAKSKDERFPDVTAFALALENALTSTPVAASAGSVAPSAATPVVAPARRAPPPTALLPESPWAAAPPVAPARRAPPPTALLPESPWAAALPVGAEEAEPVRTPAAVPAFGRRAGAVMRKSPPVPRRAGPPAQRPAVPPSGRKWPWIVATGAVVALLLGGAFLLRSRLAPLPAGNGPAAPPAPAAAVPEKSAFTPPPPAGSGKPSAEADQLAVPALAEPASESPPKPASVEPAAEKPAKHSGRHKRTSRRDRRAHRD